MLSDAAISGAGASQFSFGYNGCNPGTVSDESFCTVFVYFDPSIVGPAGASVDLETDQGTVSVPLSGTGAAGTLSANAPNFNPQPYYTARSIRTSTSPTRTPTTRSPATAPRSPEPMPRSSRSPITVARIRFRGPETAATSASTSIRRRRARRTLSSSSTTAAAPTRWSSRSAPQLSPVRMQWRRKPSTGSETRRSAPAAQPSRSTLQNQGDFPLQIQQLFIIGGAPNYFPISNESCGGRVLNPSESCTLDVQFAGSGR